ncbi:MAG: glycine cleavage system protein H, partial [Candidatus Pacebacteria bacterium]|nr:glycine cleavage system protein H [Candidatus Paceibacterota bacterium]
MLECPEHLLYSVTHTWVQIIDDEANLARVGITHHLQEELPEILSVDLPMDGDELEIDNPCMHLHLEGDTITEVCSPLTGRAVSINRDVLDNPDL